MCKYIYQCQVQKPTPDIKMFVCEGTSGFLLLFYTKKLLSLIHSTKRYKYQCNLLIYLCINQIALINHLLTGV